MFKKIIILISFSQLLFAATPKQIEQYLTLSNAEMELISLEADFSAMQNGFSRNAEGNTTFYDMQLLSLRFRDYIQRNLSESEMDEILDNYSQVVLLQFVSASQVEVDNNASQVYVAHLRANSEASGRIELVEEISAYLYSKEAMSIMFDGLMEPLMRNAKGGDKLDDEFIQKKQENYIKNRTQDAQHQMLYITKEFTIEDLEALLVIAKNSATNHEVKAVHGATAYALKDFFISIASRYDISKHEPKPTEKPKDIK